MFVILWQRKPDPTDPHAEEKALKFVPRKQTSTELSITLSDFARKVYYEVLAVEPCDYRRN